MENVECCPYCGSDDVNKYQTTVSEDKYVCRKCKAQYNKTHLGGNIIKIAMPVFGVIGFLFGIDMNNDNA